MSEEMSWPSMQDAPEAERTRQRELERRAAKPFENGGIDAAEALAQADADEPERTWNPPSMIDELGFDPDEVENRIMHPGEGIGAYASLLERPEKPALPPKEAIPELFEKMKPYRSFLTTILNTCCEETQTDAVDAAVAPCYEYCHCVHSPISLRKMLVAAGALERLTPEEDNRGLEEPELSDASANHAADSAAPHAPEPAMEGNLTDEAAFASPDFDGNTEEAWGEGNLVENDEDIDEIDDGTMPDDQELKKEEDAQRGSIYDQDGYLVIEEEPEGTWKTTQAGLDYLESIDPERQFDEALAAHPEIDDVFYDVIAYCQEHSRNITDIVKRFEDDARLGPDTYYASYVVDRLEEIGALEWRGNWRPTELGEKLLAERPVR